MKKTVFLIVICVLLLFCASCEKSKELSTNPDMQEMLDYARENHIQCGNTAYAFYVYSLMQEDIIGDYYEIFMPIL